MKTDHARANEFLAIPNVASDTENIQKNAAHLVEMLEARGIETHLLPISGRGPVVFGKLNAPDAKRTVIFYAHYDGQPVDPAAWTDGKPFEPVLRSNSIEAGGKAHSVSQQASPARTTTTGAFTRVRLPTTSPRLWRCSHRSMRCARRGNSFGRQI